MLDLNVIKKKLLRFSGLDFKPTAPEGWTELANVLQRSCATMDHVDRVISRWLEVEENIAVPKPGQLAALAHRTPADPAMDNPILPGGCEHCGLDGDWVWVERLDRDGNPVGCLGRCTCARGRQFAALDAKRAQELAARERKQPSRMTSLNGRLEGTGS